MIYSSHNLLKHVSRVFFSLIHTLLSLCFLYMLVLKDLPSVNKNNYRITEQDYF